MMCKRGNLVFQVHISNFPYFGAKTSKNNEKSLISGKILYRIYFIAKISSDCNYIQLKHLQFVINAILTFAMSFCLFLG